MNKPIAFDVINGTVAFSEDTNLYLYLTTDYSHPSVFATLPKGTYKIIGAEIITNRVVIRDSGFRDTAYLAKLTIRHNGVTWQINSYYFEYNGAKAIPENKINKELAISHIEQTVKVDIKDALMKAMQLNPYLNFAHLVASVIAQSDDPQELIDLVNAEFKEFIR